MGTTVEPVRERRGTKGGEPRWGARLPLWFNSTAVAQQLSRRGRAAFDAASRKRGLCNLCRTRHGGPGRLRRPFPLPLGRGGVPAWPVVTLAHSAARRRRERRALADGAVRINPPSRPDHTAYGAIADRARSRYSAAAAARARPMVARCTTGPLPHIQVRLRRWLPRAACSARRCLLRSPS